MTDEQFQVIVAGFQAVLGLLQEIRDALIGVDEPAEDGICLHPEQDRVDMRTLSDPDHWICNRCRYEHRGLIQN